MNSPAQLALSDLDTMDAAGRDRIKRRIVAIASEIRDDDERLCDALANQIKANPRHWAPYLRELCRNDTSFAWMCQSALVTEAREQF